MTELRGRDWRQVAACARPGIDPELFFPSTTEVGKTRQAKQICAGCAVQAPCLADALSRPESADHGIFGGTTPKQRGQIRKQVRRGGRYRPTPMTDPALAAEAFELARRIGTMRTAQQLGVEPWRLYRAWDEWRLGRPTRRGLIRSPGHILDPLAAQRAFQLAEQVGPEAAAERLGIARGLLDDAWQHWGLGRPDGGREAARRDPEARARDRVRSRHFDQFDPAEAAMPRALRTRSLPDQERER